MRDMVLKLRQKFLVRSVVEPAQWLMQQAHKYSYSYLCINGSHSSFPFI